jgi:hypothetical protein
MAGWGAMVGALYACWQTTRDRGFPADLNGFAYLVGSMLGGIAFGAALFALISVLRNRILGTK